MRFFSHPCFEKVTFPAKSLLKSCVAIELTKENLANTRLIILATQSSPCHVTMLFGEFNNLMEYEARLLEEMTEIEIDYFKDN